MCGDRNPSNELIQLLKSRSRSAKDWSYSIAGAFWQNKGQIIDEEYLFICLANAMMSMYDSIFNKEIKQLEKELQETKAQLKQKDEEIEKAKEVIERLYNNRDLDEIDSEDLKLTVEWLEKHKEIK